MASEPYINLSRGRSNSSWAFIGDLFILYSCTGDLSDERLAEMSRECLARRIKYALGTGIGRGGLTSVQRKQAAETFKGLTRIATVYDDRMTRGIITALGWLGLNIKSFDWPQLDAAIAYLSVPNIPPEQIVNVLDHLKASTTVDDK
jgi:hypothetical protein